MAPLIMIGVVIIAILFILLGSVYIGGKRPYFRIIFNNGAYVIQYRKMWVRWKTYVLPGSGEAAVYYVRTEAEDMIKTLIERRKQTNSFDAMARTSTVQVLEYDEQGGLMNSKHEKVK